MKKIHIVACYFLASPLWLFSAPLTQSDVTGYWACKQGSLETITYISTDYTTSSADTRVNPETWDVSTAPGTEVIGKALMYSDESYMTQIDSDKYLAGIYNGPTTGEFADYTTSTAAKWEFYGGVDNSSLTVGNLTSILPSAENNNSLIIRKKAAAKNFSLSVGEIWASGGNSVTLGTSSAGCFLSNLTLGNAETGGTINVSDDSTLYIRASNLTSYVTEINLNGGELNIYKGVSNDTEAYTDCTADFSAATMNVSGISLFRFGTDTKRYTTDLSLGNINIAADGSNLSFAAYTTGNVSLGDVVSYGTGSITVYANSFTIGNIDHYSRFNYTIGSSSVGGGLETVNLTGSKINLTGIDASNLAQMQVYTHYLGSTEQITDITVSNGLLGFFGGAYDDAGTTAYYGYDVDLSNATITLAGKNTLRFGYTWNTLMDGTLSLGDVVMSSSDLNSEWSIYTTKGSIYVNSISTAVKGGTGSSIFFKINNKNIIVAKDVELAVESVQLYGGMTVNGNYLNSFEGDSFLRAQYAYTSPLCVVGSFETQGTFVVGIADNTVWTSKENTALVVGGITGDTAGSKITTGYNYEAYTANTGTPIVELTGEGNYSTTTALVDFAADGNPTELALTGALVLNKTGKGVQYLRGENMYRGQTTVSAGELYINADGSGNSAGWGIGAVSLVGGKFGAVGADGDIGKVVVTDLTWSNAATIGVDVSMDGSSDLIAISGNFLKTESDSEGKYIFDFSGTFAAEETMYKIMAWEDSSAVDFTADDFGYTYNGEEVVLDGTFVIQDNGLYFVSVPEPAEYAALFGAMALALALIRRRRK